MKFEIDIPTTTFKKVKSDLINRCDIDPEDIKEDEKVIQELFVLDLGRGDFFDFREKVKVKKI